MNILRSACVRADFQLPRDTYAGWVLLAALGGAFSFAIDGGEKGEARFGDLVFCPPGRALRRRAVAAPFTFFFAEFAANGAEEIPAGKVTVANLARLSSTFAELFRLAGRHDHESDRWRVHLLRDLLYLCRNTAAAGLVDPLMARVAGHLEEEAATPLALADVARGFGLSPVQLSRRFAAAHNGVPPIAFLRAVRLRKAQTLLRETDWTIERVALACGFRDGFYLARVFQKTLGTSPSAFRRSNRV